MGAVCRNLAHMDTTLRDLLEFSASRVERSDNGAIVVRRVKFLGNRSANVNEDGTHNVYPLETRRAALPLYEGCKVHTDHPDRRTPGVERSIRDQLGRLRNCEAMEDGSYADLHINPKHELAEFVAWSAEHSPDDLGLSHNAQGIGRIEGQECLIEKTTHVRSVDVVLAGATTAGLFESQREPMTVMEQLVAAMQAAEKSLLEECDEAALVAVLSDESLSPDEKVTKALALVASGNLPEKDPEEGDEPEEGPAVESKIVESLRLELDALKAKDAAREKFAARDRMLEESRLPKEALTETFVETVREADEDRAKALIEDRRRVWFHQHPVAGVSTTSKTEITSRDDLLSFLKGGTHG